MIQESKKFHLINENVCTRLKLHGEEVKDLLVQNSWEKSDQERADILLINTCAFLAKKEQEALERIGRLDSEKSPSQALVVFGCLPLINPTALVSLGIDSVASRDMAGFADKFDLKQPQTPVGHNFERGLNRFSKFNRFINQKLLHDPYFEYLYEKENVFHLKIASGCLGNCAYCCEKLARGPLKSQSTEDILEEFKKGRKMGYHLFSLNADDVGTFGLDHRENVASLVEALLKEDDDFKLVLTEFNPWGLIRYKEKLIEILQSPQIVFITVPLQSGSDPVLKRMRRPYQIGQVMEVLREINKNNRQLKINTHLIVGFPGETEENFQATVTLVKGFKFNKIKVFKYSDRPRTESYNMPNKISEEEKDRRQKVLTRTHFTQLITSLDLKGILLNMGSYF